MKDMLGTVALMALLAVAYGAVTRSLDRPATAQAVLGTLFGGVSVLAMFDPLQVADGVIVDLRLVPVILAGAFLGRLGAIVTTLVALTARVEIGGTGLAAGSAGILGTALAGLAWARLAGRPPSRGKRNVALLATLSLLPLVFVALLPWTLAWRVVTTVWPFYVPFQFAGIVVVGSLLERERLLADEERSLSLAAARDPLTGLLNRRGFEAATARLPPEGRGAALLVLDLDRFKRVNDEHGHAAGDAVLRSLGARLSNVLRVGDVVARFGGEEVVVFLSDLDERAARDAAERLCEVVRAQPFILPSGRRLAVTASLGGSWTAERVGLDALMLRADAALYAAKHAGRDCCRFDEAGRPAEEPAGPARAARRHRIAA